MTIGLGLIAAAGAGSAWSVSAVPQLSAVPPVQAAYGTAPAVPFPRIGPMPQPRGSARTGTGHGTVVIDGHVDTASDGRGALFYLRDLRPGDPVVLSSDRGPRRFVIAALRSFVKADLPADLFATSGQPRLVIITCGGAFDAKTRHYADNVVAYAVPA